VRTILVTGGTGFIGVNLVNYLNEKYPEDRTVVLDILTYAGSVENLPKDMRKASIRCGASRTATYATRSWWTRWPKRLIWSSSPPRPRSPVRWTNDQSTECDYESVGGVDSLVTRSILR
jgi:hypothetical protein